MAICIRTCEIVSSSWVMVPLNQSWVGRHELLEYQKL